MTTNAERAARDDERCAPDRHLFQYVTWGAPDCRPPYGTRCMCGAVAVEDMTLEAQLSRALASQAQLAARLARVTEAGNAMIEAFEEALQNTWVDTEPITRTWRALLTEGGAE